MAVFMVFPFHTGHLLMRLFYGAVGQRDRVGGGLCFHLHSLLVGQQAAAELGDVEREGVSDEEAVKGWIQRAVKFVGKLPAKQNAARFPSAPMSAKCCSDKICPVCMIHYRASQENW
ncbi:MAG TPA: hypothetical protein VFE62_11020 [Gemmataceae bacterium]|nr:hypothetical protein [Gemmataceae bacterium]